MNFTKRLERKKGGKIFEIQRNKFLLIQMDVSLILKLKKFSYWFYNKLFRIESMKNCKNQRKYTKDPLLTKVLGLKFMLSVSNTKDYLHLSTSLDTEHKSLISHVKHQFSLLLQEDIEQL